jgi:hypothetical protein
MMKNGPKNGRKKHHLDKKNGGGVAGSRKKISQSAYVIYI